MKIRLSIVMVLLTLLGCIYLWRTNGYCKIKKWFTLFFSSREEFSYENIDDPVFMFDWIIDLCETNGNPQLNANCPYKFAIMDKAVRQSIIHQIKSEGLRFSTRIVAIHTSAALESGHLSQLSTTGLTTIICSNDHYCNPGSTITIEGIPGLNDTYLNGVSLWNCVNEKSDIDDRVDSVSARGTLHSFNLIKDSYGLSCYQEGIQKGYMKEVSQDAKVHVTHRIKSDMSFNEWWACILSTIQYLYGSSIHSYLVGYAVDVYGRLPTTWDTISHHNDTILKVKSRNFDNVDPSSYFVTYSLRHRNKEKRILERFSLFSRGWINDPYSVVSLFDSVFYPSIQSSYDQISVPDEYGPTNYCNIIPILHYLRKDTVKNVYWGLDGTDSQSLEQQEISSQLNLFNLTTKSIVGGTRLRARLFNFANPYDKQNILKYRDDPNPQQWVLLGSTDTKEGKDRKNHYLQYFCGVIDTKFTQGKIIGYIHFADYTYYNTIAAGCAHLFSPPRPSDWSGSFTKWHKAGYALMTVIDAIMYELVQVQKCDSIIIDNRKNQGGLYSESFCSFFGGDRYNWSRYQLEIDNGYSFPISDDTDEFNTFFSKIQASLANTLSGSVFKGTPDHVKKVVILTNIASGSEGENVVNHFYGDNGDLYLGDHVYAHIMGSKSIGCINSGNGQSFYTPAFSSRHKANIEFAIETGISGSTLCLNTVPSGPLYLKPWYADGFWNRTTPSTYQINEEIRSLSEGSALREDMSILYYALGIFPSPPNYFIPYENYRSPSPSDPFSWKDVWLEQSIKEACSPVISQYNLYEIYPDWELVSEDQTSIFSPQSFLLNPSYSVMSKNGWDSLQFNLQLDFTISKGNIWFDPTRANDKGNVLVPSVGYDSCFMGFVNSNKTPLYGVNLRSTTFVKDRYKISFVSGPKLEQAYTVETSFPVSVSILCMGGSQIYFKMNGFDMYKDNMDPAYNMLYFKAFFKSNVSSSTSILLVENVSFK